MELILKKKYNYNGFLKHRHAIYVYGLKPHTLSLKIMTLH